MQIELVGCTCAGKTTLANKMLAAGQTLGIDVQLSDDFILNYMRLNWLKNEFVRRRAVEWAAFAACLWHVWSYRKLYVLMISICCSVPGSLIYRLKIIRVSLKKIGIYEIIRQRSTDNQWILIDNEGVLQTSHTLFVHAGSELRIDRLADFYAMAPLPDAIAYLRLPEAVLIERTLKRGHNRVPDVSKTQEVSDFIAHAVRVFEELIDNPRFSDRLVVVDGVGNTVLANQSKVNPKIQEVVKLILAGMNQASPGNISVAERSAEQTSDQGMLATKTGYERG